MRLIAQNRPLVPLRANALGEEGLIAVTHNLAYRRWADPRAKLGEHFITFLFATKAACGSAILDAVPQMLTWPGILACRAVPESLERAKSRDG